MTFESKTAGGDLKPGSSGHIGRKFNTEENESLNSVELKWDYGYNQTQRWLAGRPLSVVVHMSSVCLRSSSEVRHQTNGGRGDGQGSHAEAEPSDLSSGADDLGPAGIRTVPGRPGPSPGGTGAGQDKCWC